MTKFDITYLMLLALVGTSVELGIILPGPKVNLPWVILLSVITVILFVAVIRRISPVKRALNPKSN